MRCIFIGIRVYCITCNTIKNILRSRTIWIYICISIGYLYLSILCFLVMLVATVFFLQVGSECKQRGLPSGRNEIWRPVVCCSVLCRAQLIIHRRGVRGCTRGNRGRSNGPRRV